MRRGLRPAALAAALLLLAGSPGAAKQVSGGAAKQSPGTPPTGAEPQGAPSRARIAGEAAAILEALRLRSPQDTLGNAAYDAARVAFEQGRFDEAVRGLEDFTQRFPRNLQMNDALSLILLIRYNREFKDEPLRIYAAAEAQQRAGRADSAAALAREGLQRYPGARIRDHWSWLLAEAARDRGDHAAAVSFAAAVADTSLKSRLAPYALRLAAEETLAMSGDPTRALHYYQDLLERYPTSPLAPEARARVFELRKKLQL